MSELKTFVLSKKNTFRRGVRVFLRDKDGKFSARTLMFTKESVINKKDRSKPKGRLRAAEYRTGDANIIDALYSDTAYGKDFFEKGDKDGKKKKASRQVSEEDAGMVALENLFNAAKLPFDSQKPLNVLKEEYKLHVAALSGAKIEPSTASEIPHTPIDVQADIIAQKNDARAKYEEIYGEPVPEVVYNDSAFLDGISNPDFDAPKYIEAKLAEGIEVNSEEHEALLENYQETFGTKPPNSHKNNIGWLLKKLG